MLKNADLLFKDKTVLITGHTGFKGAWLAIWLNELGANVIGYSLDPEGEKNLFVLSKLNKKIIDIRGDIRDYEKLKSVFDQYNPEIVFHLAAQSIVKYSIRPSSLHIRSKCYGDHECVRSNTEKRYSQSRYFGY